MPSCSIILDNFLGFYNTGNTVSGHVVCLCECRQTIRGIKVSLRGEEHTSWEDRDDFYDVTSKYKKRHNVEYSGDNTIVSFDILLVGDGTISAGRYEYPFSFTLPKDLPSTYNGKYGSIRYYVKANVDVPFSFSFYGDEKTINVISQIDFNEIKNELQLKPINYEYEKILCCLCCASEPISLNVKLEKEAFVLGEVAKIVIDIKNRSKTAVSRVLLQLKMTTESKVTFPHTGYKEISEILTVTSDTDGVKAHRQRSYEFNLDIPKTIILPNFSKSTLFKKWCDINVIATMFGCHTDMNINNSVILGHIPIQESTNP